MREMILGVCLSVTILLNGAPGASAAADGACVAPPPALGSFQPADGTKRLPDAPYVDAEGQDQPLAGLRGTGLVLNLWATWCPPCVEEMPALDTLAGEAPALGLRVLALSADREGATVVRKFYAVNDIRNLAVALDRPSRVARALGVAGLPTTVLYNAEGREVGRVTGVADWDAPEVTAFLHRCLVASPANSPANSPIGT